MLHSSPQTELFEKLPNSSGPSNGGFKNGSINKLHPNDRSVHDWYRFVLSYPPHLVRHYIKEFRLAKNATVLDPFCGTGTTLVEAKLLGLQAIGVEANPLANFAASVKTNWTIDADAMQRECNKIAAFVRDILQQQNIDDHADCSSKIDPEVLRALPAASEKLLLKNSISPLPLHKSLLLLEEIRKRENALFCHHLLLALAKTLVFKVSNLKFGPEVGIGKIKNDAPVVLAWLDEIQTMASDLRKPAGADFPPAQVFLSDARNIAQILQPNSIDAVITSPPYPNEKDYTRTTRLESVILGFITDKDSLRDFKKTLVRSNTRGVYKTDNDDHIVEQFPEIVRIAEEIETRRIQMGKTSGFERAYAKVTKLYFGGMYKHLQSLIQVLKPGAQLAYVVGDQASYLRVMIRTGQLLAQIAGSLGYEHVRTDLFRTRLATATGEQLREEVVILKWQGRGRKYFPPTPSLN